MINKARKTLPALAALALGVAPLAAHADWGGLNMPVGVTELSKQIYSLHMTIFWWCVAIGVFVFGWMIWSLVAFRHSKGAKADTTIVHSTRAEIIWTVIPVVILVIMAIPAARTLIAIEDTRNTELTIKVTGYQWKWQYEYLARPRQQRGPPAPVRDRSRFGAGLPPERRQPAGGSRGHQGPGAAHRAGRHPRLVGARFRDEKGRHPGLHQ
jgi:cytochrome c oxidase subunit 2